MFGKILFIALVFIFGLGVGLFISFDSSSLRDVLLSPSDFLENQDVTIYDDRVEIKVSGAMLSSYSDSGSMSPTLGAGVNGITVKPASERDIELGDIVSFLDNGELIVHRVVEKGEDAEGVYFITKGDANEFRDVKIRFSDIERVLIGIVY